MSLIDQAREQMAKTVENTKENFSGIRTGRANPALLNGITVDYYGAATPIKAVASIGVPEPAPCLSLRSTPPRPAPSKRPCAIPTSASARTVTATSSV